MKDEWDDLVFRELDALTNEIPLSMTAREETDVT